MNSKLIMLFVLLAAQVLGETAPVGLNLLDGSILKGRVMSVTASEVTFMTDFGVSRIALEKLTPESRQNITQGSKPDGDALLKRIAELEAKVSQLQQENETLRRQIVSTGSASPTAPTTKPATGASYTISSTGKRHNSNCRYFGSGKPCGATDGVACKVCGG